MSKQMKLLCGDCLELMKEIPDKSVDMILCDLPYGCTNRNSPSAKWDNVIPFPQLWDAYRRVIKDNGAIILFGTGMFTAKVMQSNEKWWRYNLIWKKGDRVTGFLNARRQPCRNHEDIIVFYKKQPTYNPQMEKCEPHKRNHSRGNGQHKETNNIYGKYMEVKTVVTDEKFPKSVITVQPEHKDFFHPSQKPIELLEWLIKTYTNEGETVLDNCTGSGSTGVACVKTGRNFIGIELDEQYFAIAQKRIESTVSSAK